MIPMLVVYEFLEMWFSWKINISSHLMLSYHLHLYLFCLVFFNPQQLWKGSNQFLCMKNVVDMSLTPLPLCPFRSWPDAWSCSCFHHSSFVYSSFSTPWLVWILLSCLSCCYFIHYFYSLLLQSGHETWVLAKCNASRTSSTWGESYLGYCSLSSYSQTYWQ